MSSAPASAPRAPKLIERYGKGGFRVSGQTLTGSILVFNDRVESWPVADIAQLSVEALQPIIAAQPPIQILLLGCGPRIAFIAPPLRQALRAAGVVIEAMDTGAACRTYNVLLAEERRVAAALIAVD
jgi:uncharacterized protein